MDIFVNDVVLGENHNADWVRYDTWYLNVPQENLEMFMVTPYSFHLLESFLKHKIHKGHYSQHNFNDVK
jgi:hypothetical protein